jgi:putative MATE family efflux protein
MTQTTVAAKPAARVGHAGLADLAGSQLGAAQLRKRVIALAWPSVADNLLATMVSIVAMIMVGSLGSNAIAAVGISNQLVWLAYVVFMALGVGATALVARAIGGGNQAEANQVARQGLLLSCVLSVVVTVVGLVGARQFLASVASDAELVAMALPHFAISMATCLLAAISFGLAAVLRGAGDMKSPMFANAVANVCNVVFLYGLINGRLGMPRMGVAGAAVGSSLARLVACAILLWVVAKGKSPIRLSMRDNWRPDVKMLTRIGNVGLPSAAEQGLMTFGMLVFTRMVVAINTETYAAHQIALNVAQLSFMPGQGFAMAATTLVGQSLGAKRPDLAERFATVTQRLGAMVMGAMGVVFFVFGRQIAALYTSEAVVLALAAQALRYSSFSQVPNSVYFIYAGALRGAGDTRWPLYITGLGIWVIRLNLARYLISTLALGLLGVWTSIIVDMLARSVVMGLRFRSGRWKTIRV